MKNKWISRLLVLVMVIGMIPFTAFAAEEETVYISVSLDGNYLTAGTGTNKGNPMAYLPVTLKVLKNSVKLANYGLDGYSYDADGDGAEEAYTNERREAFASRAYRVQYAPMFFEL